MRAAWWIGAAALAGCATTSAQGLATVAVTPKPDVAAPAARGETAMVVRAVPAGADGTELQGAACVADSAYFTASFTAPAQLLMPDFGPASPEVTVSCRAGTATGTLAARPVQAWSGGLGGWPAVGVSVGTGSFEGVGVGVGWYGGAAGVSTGGASARYPEVRVPMVERAG